MARIATARQRAADVVARARRSDVLMYPIAIGRVRPRSFAELATVTGGRSFHLRDPKDLQPTLQAIAEDLRSQYLIGYEPRAVVGGESPNGGASRSGSIGRMPVSAPAAAIPRNRTS